ncbi:MAG TPA: hypothetical protein VJT67_14290 [Longimicrobiaceae bacterium]|nr:hypothetical protein [Longimicrobiaceae bacterium]
MPPIRLAWIASAALMLGVTAPHLHAQTGRVCPDPAHPCPGFKAHDLSFVLPRDGVARAEVRSAQYFAVVLRSGRHCAIPESARVEAQRLFPGRKVFSQRFECDDDAENNVHYAPVDPQLAFLAVYAGGTRREANATLTAVQRTGHYPGAYLRRLQVVFVSP